MVRKEVTPNSRLEGAKLNASHRSCVSRAGRTVAGSADSAASGARRRLNHAALPINADAPRNAAAQAKFCVPIGQRGSSQMGKARRAVRLPALLAA